MTSRMTITGALAIQDDDNYMYFGRTQWIRPMEAMEMSSLIDIMKRLPKNWFVA